jgi:hypothetical protein
MLLRGRAAAATASSAAVGTAAAPLWPCGGALTVAVLRRSNRGCCGCCGGCVDYCGCCGRGRGPIAASAAAPLWRPLSCCGCCGYCGCGCCGAVVAVLQGLAHGWRSRPARVRGPWQPVAGGQGALSGGLRALAGGQGARMGSNTTRPVAGPIAGGAGGAGGPRPCFLCGASGPGSKRPTLPATR